MTSLRVLLLAGILMASAAGAAAQAVVRGRVTDRQTGEPLAGVYVIWGRGLGTATDATGSFSFSAGAGTVTIDFRFIGYRSWTETLTVTAGSTAVLDIKMDPEARSLDQEIGRASCRERV